MKYKVGDRVRIVSKPLYGMHDDMHKYLGVVMTIEDVFGSCYHLAEDLGDWFWTDEMIEGLEDECKAHDAVEHPSHYCHGGMECIDEMVAVFGVEAVKSFCLCNVWKYRKRALYKNGEEDLKKSDWYMNKFVELGGKL